jgi:hypothetical protein
MDTAAYAQTIVDEWHNRLIVGALARPSPTIGAALAAGYGRVMIYCESCRHGMHIPLRQIRRPPRTQIIDLAPMLICERCGPSGPLPRITGVTGQIRHSREPLEGLDVPSTGPVG